MTAPPGEDVRNRHRGQRSRRVGRALAKLSGALDAIADTSANGLTSEDSLNSARIGAGRDRHFADCGPMKLATHELSLPVERAHAFR